jgi:hypothetical protein
LQERQQPVDIDTSWIWPSASVFLLLATLQQQSFSVQENLMLSWSNARLMPGISLPGQQAATGHIIPVRPPVSQHQMQGAIW